MAYERTVGSWVPNRPVMKLTVCIAAFSALALAVDDPSTKYTEEKEMREFLNDKLTDLKEEQIEALGTKNKDICKKFKPADLEESSHSSDDDFVIKFRKHVNLDCVLAIADTEPKVIDKMIKDYTSMAQNRFFARLGAVNVCLNKKAWDKTDRKIRDALNSYCDSTEAKFDLAEAEKKKKDSSGNLFKASATIALASLVIVGLLI